MKLDKDHPLWGTIDITVRTALLFVTLKLLASNFDDTEELTLLIYLLGSGVIVGGLGQLKKMAGK